jgi:hypothetical protein
VPLKPPFPPVPGPTTPSRTIAPHVRAATGLVQARPAPLTGATRTPAPHVQVALGSALQRKPSPGQRIPAPHVQTAVAQTKTVPAAGPAVPRIETPKTGGVLQRAKQEKSMDNIRNYSSLLDHYDEDEVREVLESEDLRVRGHHSGKPGDGMNSATKQDLDNVGKVLKKKKEVEKRSKKQPKVHQQAPKTWYAKAEAMAETIFSSEGPDGLVTYQTYLDKQLENKKITNEEYDDLYQYFVVLGTS